MPISVYFYTVLVFFPLDFKGSLAQNVLEPKGHTEQGCLANKLDYFAESANRA